MMGAGGGERTAGKLPNLFLFPVRHWVVPDVPQVFLLGIKRRQDEEKGGRRETRSPP